MVGIFSCQKDDSFNETENTTPTNRNNGVSVQRLTLDDLNQKQSLSEPLLKMKGFLDVDKASGENARLTTTDSTFTVLTDEIVEVTTSNSMSYSFLTESPINPNADYENLVLYKKGDEPFKFYLYSYITVFYNGALENQFISRLLIDGETYGLEFLGQLLAERIFMDGQGCVWNIYESGNDLVLHLLSCPSTGSTGAGGQGGTFFDFNNGAEPSESDHCEAWSFSGVANGKCKWVKTCIDSSGKPYGYTLDGPCNGDEEGGNINDNGGNNGNTGDNGGLDNGDPGDGGSDDGSSGTGSNSNGTGTGNTSNPPEIDEGETVGVNTAFIFRPANT